MNTSKRYPITDAPPKDKCVNIFYIDNDGNESTLIGFNSEHTDVDISVLRTIDQYGTLETIGTIHEWSYLTKEQECLCRYTEFFAICDDEEYNEFKQLYELIKESFYDEVFYDFYHNVAITAQNLLKSLLYYEIYVLKQEKKFVVNKIYESGYCKDCGNFKSEIFILYEKLESDKLIELSRYGNRASCYVSWNGYSDEIIVYLLNLYCCAQFDKYEIFNFSDEEGFKYLEKVLNVEIEYKELDNGQTNHEVIEL